MLLVYLLCQVLQLFISVYIKPPPRVLPSFCHPVAAPLPMQPIEIIQQPNLIHGSERCEKPQTGACVLPKGAHGSKGDAEELALK